MEAGFVAALKSYGWTDLVTLAFLQTIHLDCGVF